MYRKSNQSGFGHVLLVALIVVVAAVVGFAGWYVYRANSKTNLNLSKNAPLSTGSETSSKNSGSNVITVRTIPEADNVSSDNPTANPTVTTTPQPTPIQTYSEYMDITEWGVKVPTNSQYMGYRWDISTGANNDLVSVFITDDTNGLYMDVGCSAGNIQGIYLSRDNQYHESEDDFMPDANLNIGGHTYYVYKSICEGKVSSSVENLASKVDLMSLK